MPEIGPSIDC